MKMIPLIWLMFTILFACFGAYHFIQLSHSFPNFEWQSFKEPGGNFHNNTAIENSINLKKFVAQWNEYIDKQNTSSFRIHFIAAITYSISAFMAGVSMFLPGHYNIKDTANDLRKYYSKTNLKKKFMRPIKPEKNKSNNVEHK